jgi:hypothetical protein
MKPDELEAERAALLADIDAGRPFTDDHRRRVAAVMSADMARPKSPIEQAVRVLLDEAAAATDRDPPPGLTIRDLEADPLEVLTATGELYTLIPKASLHDLAARLGAGRN